MARDNSPITLHVALVSGMNAGKAVKWITMNDEEIRISDNGAVLLGRIHLENVVDIRVEDVKAGGLFKKTVPGMVIDFKTKAGEARQIVLQLLDHDEVYARAFAGRLAAMKEDALWTKENLHVRGVNYYEDAILDLSSENEDYGLTKKEAIEAGMEDEPIYQLDIYAAKFELVPENDNEYDPKAVAVYADGKKIGYVAKGSTSHIRELLAEANDLKISGDLGGGQYKVLTEDEDGKLNWETGEKPFWASVQISYKK